MSDEHKVKILSGVQVQENGIIRNHRGQFIGRLNGVEFESEHLNDDVDPVPSPMLVALDYDGTYTKDPELWLLFIKLAQARGHEVVVATMRTFEETHDMDERLTDLINRVVPTDRMAKKPFLASYGMRPDIWIDDQPEFLLLDAAKD